MKPKPTFKSVQEIALQGVYGKKAGYLKFYELQLELEARGIKEYPGSKNGRLDVLKDVLCGVQRYPLFCCSPLKYVWKICHYKGILYFHLSLCMIRKGTWVVY